MTAESVPETMTIFSCAMREAVDRNLQLLCCLIHAEVNRVKMFSYKEKRHIGRSCNKTKTNGIYRNKTKYQTDKMRIRSSHEDLSLGKAKIPT